MCDYFMLPRRTIDALGRLQGRENTKHSIELAGTQPGIGTISTPPGTISPHCDTTRAQFSETLYRDPLRSLYDTLLPFFLT